MRKILVTFVPGLVAACFGACLGHYAARWLLGQGRDASLLPGAFAGLACGFASIDRSKVRGLICAVVALVAGLISYGKLWHPPFRTDGTFLDLAAHAHRLLPYTQIMLSLGAFLGFWWGRETTFPWRHRLANDQAQHSPRVDPPANDG